METSKVKFTLPKRNIFSNSNSDGQKPKTETIWFILAIFGGVLLLYALARLVSVQRRLRDLESKPPVDDITLRGAIRVQLNDLIGDIEQSMRAPSLNPWKAKPDTIILDSPIGPGIGANVNKVMNSNSISNNNGFDDVDVNKTLNGDEEAREKRNADEIARIETIASNVKKMTLPSGLEDFAKKISDAKNNIKRITTQVLPNQAVPNQISNQGSNQGSNQVPNQVLTNQVVPVPVPKPVQQVQQIQQIQQLQTVQQPQLHQVLLQQQQVKQAKQIMQSVVSVEPVQLNESIKSLNINLNDGLIDKQIDNGVGNSVGNSVAVNYGVVPDVVSVTEKDVSVPSSPQDAKRPSKVPTKNRQQRAPQRKRVMTNKEISMDKETELADESASVHNGHD